MKEISYTELLFISNRWTLGNCILLIYLLYLDRVASESSPELSPLLPVSSLKVVRALLQGFQYFSSVPVLHYLQMVLFIKIWTFCMNIFCNTLLKLGGTNYHFKGVKVSGTAP